MNQEKIGKFIADCRREKNLTQQELADKLGLNNKTISRWENGHYMPDISLFKQLCEILDINVTELLNGERLNKIIGKEKMNIAVDNIVNMSKREINQKRKKIIIIFLSIVILLTIIFTAILYKYHKDKEDYLDNGLYVGNEVPFPTKIAFEEKEDGWVCYFTMEYFRDNLKTPYYYEYGCDNFKYKELNDFYGVGTEIDPNGNTYEYEIDINHPSYYYNQKYGIEITEINEYFLKKGFNKIIEMDDLKDLKLSYIKKEDILELYNKAISSKSIYMYGNFPNTNVYKNLVVSNTYNGLQWELGYTITMGHITYINIELIINNQFLSDLITSNKATEEQKLIYQSIKKIENNIIKTQKFSVIEELRESQPYFFLNSDNIMQINSLLY